MKRLRERGGEKERLRGRECECAWGVGGGRARSSCTETRDRDSEITSVKTITASQMENLVFPECKQV